MLKRINLILVCVVVLTVIFGMRALIFADDGTGYTAEFTVSSAVKDGKLTNIFEVHGKEEQDVHTFFALYDGEKRLVSVSHKRYKTDENGYVSDTESVNIDENATYYQKALLWDDEMTPLAGPVCFTTDGNYAYVIAMAEVEQTTAISLKILDESGSVMTVGTASEIYFNKSEVTSEGNAKRPARDLLTNSVVMNNMLFNLIKYKTDIDGNITEILTKNNPDQNSERGLKQHTLPSSVRYDQNVPYFHLTTHTMDPVMLDQSTVVFSVPNNTTITAEHRFTVGGKEKFKHNTTYGGSEGVVEVYNVDSKMNKATLVLYRYGPYTGGNYYDNLHSRNMQFKPYMVDAVSKKEDEDGVMGYYITFAGVGELKFSNETLSDYTAGNYQNLVPDDLTKGDIVLAQIDYYNVVYNMGFLRQMEQTINEPRWTNGFGDWAGSSQYMSGHVNVIQGNIVLINTVESYFTNRYYHFNTRDLPIIIYDTSLSKNPIYTGDIQDVAIGDVMMIRTTDGWAQYVFVYKGI